MKREQWRQFEEEARVLYFVLKHPRTRWYVKCLAACPVAYLFSPVQLIPSFVPVIGFLDDFLAVFVGAKLVRKLTPPELLEECRELAVTTEVSSLQSGGWSSGRAAALLKIALALGIAGSVIVSGYVYPVAKRFPNLVQVYRQSLTVQGDSSATK